MSLRLVVPEMRFNTFLCCPLQILRTQAGPPCGVHAVCNLGQCDLGLFTNPVQLWRVIEQRLGPIEAPRAEDLLAGRTVPFTSSGWVGSARKLRAL